jgi:hypothetical protein
MPRRSPALALIDVWASQSWVCGGTECRLGCQISIGATEEGSLSAQMMICGTAERLPGHSDIDLRCRRSSLGSFRCLSAVPHKIGGATLRKIRHKK